jgi:dTMP kinase
MVANTLIVMDQKLVSKDVSSALRAKEGRGKFITLEGGEGAGKSTQAQMLAEHLQSLGLGVLVTREPGGSPGAEIIRHVLLSGAAKPLGAETEAVLFAAARQEHVKCAIEPALAAGKWVVCDRFADSTRVYQGALGKVNARFLKGLERVSIGDLAPNLTLILDLPVDEGLKRVASRRGNAKPDRFEAEDPDFHQKLRSAYLALARQEPERCVIIDANKSIKKTAKEIWSVVESKLDPMAAQAATKKSGWWG